MKTIRERSPPASPVTDRQRQVVMFSELGLADWVIAERLGIAEATVRSHKSPAHVARAKGVGRGWWRKKDE